MEGEIEISVAAGDDVANAVDLDDGGAVDANEHFRIEPLLELLHRHPYEMRPAAGVDLRVIPARLNVIDIAHAHEPHAAMLPHGKPNEISFSPI